MHTDTQQHHESFLETYARAISPKLKAIDLYIKTSDGAMTVDDAAGLLNVSADEVRGIMRKRGISRIDRRSFFTIMEHGSSGICRLYKRELDCGSPYVYTRENVSYIYNLNIDDVNNACDRLRIKELTAFTLPILFSNILV